MIRVWVEEAKHLSNENINTNRQYKQNNNCPSVWYFHYSHPTYLHTSLIFQDKISVYRSQTLNIYNTYTCHNSIPFLTSQIL